MNKSFAVPAKKSMVAGRARAWCLAAAMFGVTAWAMNAVGAEPAQKVSSNTPAHLFGLDAVRLAGEGPFAAGVKTNREYLLALEPDRLLAPFFREAGVQPKAQSYANWENIGLDGHTAGHYISALAQMVAAGHDTPQGELGRRLDYMLAELDRCQQANGNGYIGGVPGSRELWRQIAAGEVARMRSKWVPWYNLHKTYAGLRDAYLLTGRQKAREVLVRFGDWCVNVTSGLTEAQMQQMIGMEYGGMNEVLADIYAITGDQKYLDCAKRFNHQELLRPLAQQQDNLTGKHANTQIPKVVGFARIATLTGDQQMHGAARFFWETVTRNRSVAFGGNSVSEHFNDPKNFSRMIEHREGPETCNTYNMLRLTEQLFAAEPLAAYADYYERALFNHLLSAINPERPGFVYFTPLRPAHYRVYSVPDKCFWCCVGTGMENPGRYGEFIFANARDGVFVNLFIPAEVKVSDDLTLRQETNFPYEPRTRLHVKLAKPATFALRVRHPAWVPADQFAVRVNGERVALSSKPSSYAEVKRPWNNGDVVEVDLPMRTTTERLPDGSNWVAILHGPIVLAAPAGTENLVGLYADGARMGHVAHGPLVPLDRVPSLVATQESLPNHVTADPSAGPLHFRLKDVVSPAPAQVGGREGVPLVPFFSLHNARYQMYWELTTEANLAERRERLAADERAKAAREAATVDMVAVGEQQPEVEHEFKGEESRSGTLEARRWREGRTFQYTLDTRGEKALDVDITYWSGDTGRSFDVLVNDTRIGTVELTGGQPAAFAQRRFSIPASILAGAPNGRVTVKFVARNRMAGRIFDVRLIKADPAPNAPGQPVPAPAR